LRTEWRCAPQNAAYKKFFTLIIRGYFGIVAVSINLMISAMAIRLQTGFQRARGTGRAPDPGKASTMTVKAILDRKGSDVATIEPTADVASAVKLLAARRIGALVVTSSEQEIVGIVSERDIIRVLAESGDAALGRQVTHVMTRKVVTCTRAETISSIMELMTAGKFRHLPVVEGNKLIGVISIGDVVKHRVQQIEFESAALRDYITTA
jgi:CBS domain-containing protein